MSTTTLDSEIIQHIMNLGPDVSPKSRLDQLRGYMDGTHPIAFCPEEVLQAHPQNSGITVWSAHVPQKYYYQFLTEKNGVRVLHGLFEEHNAQSVPTYRARFDNGVIRESEEFYPSGNLRVHNIPNDKGLLTKEFIYPDILLSPHLSERHTGVDQNGAGSIETYKVNPDGTRWLESFTPTQDGLKHGEVTYWNENGTIRLTEVYHYGQEHGNWYAWYPTGGPKFFQQWQHGVLVLENTWYPSGHMRQSLVEGVETNYNIPSEMSPEQEDNEPRVDTDAGPLTLETANAKLGSTNQDQGSVRMWEDTLAQAIRYGTRNVLLDIDVTGTKYELVRNHFEPRGFKVYALAIDCVHLGKNFGGFQLLNDGSLLITKNDTKLQYVCLYIPERPVNQESVWAPNL